MLHAAADACHACFNMLIAAYCCYAAHAARVITIYAAADELLLPFSPLKPCLMLFRLLRC